VTAGDTSSVACFSSPVFTCCEREKTDEEVLLNTWIRNAKEDGTLILNVKRKEILVSGALNMVFFVVVRCVHACGLVPCGVARETS